MPKWKAGELKEALKGVFDDLYVYIDDEPLRSVTITLEGIILSKEKPCAEDSEDAFNREEWEQDWE